jgi:alpha-N-arabinofuranosidase
MVPVYWENDWPCIDSKSGLVEAEYPLPDLPASNSWSHESSCDHFTGKLPIHWLTLRMPVNEKDAAFDFIPGALRLFTRAATIRGKEHPAFAGRRIRHKNWAFSANMEFSPKTESETAGIILLQSENFQYRLEMSNISNNVLLRLVRAAGKEDEILDEKNITAIGNRIVLAARCEEMSLSFFYGEDQYSLECMADNIDARILSTEYAGGFVGVLAGLFASGNGKDIENYADFFWAELKELQ